MKTKLMATIGRSIPFLALGLLVLLILDRANPITTLPTRDSGCYLYFGRLILRGDLPYINAWDSKPPGIFYINALGLWLGRDTRWGVWLLEFLFVYSATVIGFRLLRKVWNPGAAVFGMIIWIWGLDNVFWKGDLVEEFPLLFNMAALSFFVLGTRNPKNRLYDFLIGTMAVLSFLFRANNIGMEVAIACAWIILGFVQRNYLLTLKRLGMMSAGGGLALLITAIFLWSRGILVAAWDAAILYNFAYMGNHASILSSILPGFQYLGVVAWITLLGYGAAIFMGFQMVRTKKFNALIVLMIVLWPIEILLSSLSGRGYMHYFVNWLPAVALLCGGLYQISASMLFSPKFIAFLNTEKIPLTLAALFAMALGFSRVMDYSRAFTTVLFDRKYGVEEINLVSLYIRRNTNPNDTVLDWVQSGVNYMAERDAPSPFLWYPEYLASPITPQLVDGFYNDLTSNPPEIIVDAYQVAPDDILSIDPTIRQNQLNAGKGLFAGRAVNLDKTLEFIQTHYEIETVIEGEVVYRLVNPLSK